MSDNRPIGVFDSGLGGLTVVRRLVARLPQESIVYFGDTARVPYGTKTDETIVQSIAAAMENILLAAVDRGLGCCWMTAPIETGTGDLLRDLFAPGKGSLVAVLTIGHPARVPKAPARKEGRYIIL